MSLKFLATYNRRILEYCFQTGKVAFSENNTAEFERTRVSLTLNNFIPTKSSFPVLNAEHICLFPAFLQDNARKTVIVKLMFACQVSRVKFEFLSRNV